MRGVALSLVAVLAGCGAFYESIDERTCPTSSTTLTFDNFGEAFMVAHCNRCHSANSTDRKGAPGEFIFDTAEQVERHRARIYARSAGPNVSMPPGPDDPSEAEREQLAEWLVCGAPN